MNRNGNATNAIIALISVCCGGLELVLASAGWAALWFGWAALNVWAIDAAPARSGR